MLCPIIGVIKSGNDDILELTRIILDRKRQLELKNSLPGKLNSAIVNDFASNAQAMHETVGNDIYSCRNGDEYSDEFKAAFDMGNVKPIVVVRDLYEIIFEILAEAKRNKETGEVKEFFAQFSSATDVFNPARHFAKVMSGWIEFAKKNNVLVLNYTAAIENIGDAAQKIADYLSTQVYLYEVVDKFIQITESREIQLPSRSDLQQIRTNFSEENMAILDRLNKSILLPE